MKLLYLVFWWVVAFKRFFVTDREDEAQYCLFMVTIFPLLTGGVWIAVQMTQVASAGSAIALLLSAVTYLLGGLTYYTEQQLVAAIKARAQLEAGE